MSDGVTPNIGETDRTVLQTRRHHTTAKPCIARSRHRQNLIAIKGRISFKRRICSGLRGRSSLQIQRKERIFIGVHAVMLCTVVIIMQLLPLAAAAITITTAATIAVASATAVPAAVIVVQ